ncbi:hypothetical protein [Acinetobacter tianfuensis]|uniref:hypothetical protein n=1 Tax=Acinetobacter tianfuensis TaxID=2419603 RepID=UPI001BC86B89|nr:hypothetical protein [Acinetobacter tianfuensis]
MSVLFNWPMPMKFQCHHCNSCYMHPYQQENRQYPCCPECGQQGLLTGIAESSDLFCHPVHALNSGLIWAKYKFAVHSSNTRLSLKV